MVNYIIRRCTLADLEKIVILCEKHAIYEKSEYDQSGKAEKLSKAIFTDGVLNCIVAEVEGNVIGYATYTFDFSTWDAQKFIYLDCLYLEDDYRSYGIGQKLMEEVITAGKENNCINMQWQTPEFNERAIKFYKRIGATGKDKVRFTLTLND